jgi:dTDP-glucose 4,6-dehydratase
VYGAPRRSAALHREHPYNPSSPYPRPRPLDPLVGPGSDRSGCCDDQQLLQQLRPVSAHREVHSRQITNVLDGGRPKLYGAGANVRD